MTTRPFQPLERTTVSEQVRDELYRRIVSGELQPGTQLPAERALAEQFQVARTSVREAIQALVALDVIERRGNRSYVVEQLPGSQLPAADRRKKAMRTLLEARRVMEVTLFELAATRATARERAEALEMARRPAPQQLDEFARADREFHACIARACSNSVLNELYGRILETLARADLSVHVMLGISADQEPSEVIAAAAAQHLTIAEAYANGDTEAMLVAVEAHFGTKDGGYGIARRMARRLSHVDAGLGSDRIVGM
ncbi:MAG: GntR family transcriptional regulator [Acidimicrobiia bacterium]|nr:GntR family transcriptional regulator [Acidimicrobiia bacterium]